MRTAVLDAGSDVLTCMSGLYVVANVPRIWSTDVATAANAGYLVRTSAVAGVGILSDKISRIRVITIGQVVSLVGMAALLFAR